MDELTKSVISSVAEVRDKANAFIVKRLGDHGIKQIAPSHGAIFYCLFEGHELTMGEIASVIHRDKSTVTTLVDKLAALGYAEKRKSVFDARVTHVRLTAEGLALKPVFDEISDELLRIAYKGFSPDEQFFVVRLLRRMSGNFTEAAAELSDR